MTNILNLALSVFTPQVFEHHACTGRVTNAIGLDVSSYADPVELTGSVQAVPRNRYEQYGLDLNKNYITVYTSEDVLDVQRDISGDQISFNGKRYQVMSANDWRAMDGWQGLLCVEIGLES